MTWIIPLKLCRLFPGKQRILQSSQRIERPALRIVPLRQPYKRYTTFGAALLWLHDMIAPDNPRGEGYSVLFI
jgi:hypothetical protein